MTNNNKNVHNKHDRSTNAQKEYVKGLVHNLSFAKINRPRDI